MLYKSVLLKRSAPPLVLLAIGTAITGERDVQRLSSGASAAFLHRLQARATLVVAREPRTAALRADVTGSTPTVLPCTSIFAPEANDIPMTADGDYFVLNYVPRGAVVSGDRASAGAWSETARELYRALSQRGRVVLACHTRSELRAARALIPDAETFWSAEYRDYLHFYAQSRGGIFNRVHGALPSIGLGKPTVLASTDSRRESAELLGEPQFAVRGATAERLLAAFDERLANRERRLAELRARKAKAEERYLALLRGALPGLVGARPTA